VPLDRETFRSVMGSFPSGVTIVATSDTDGEPKGLTTQSFIALSAVPPLLLVSLDKSSRTLAAVRRTGAFVVNFLAAGREDLSKRFAAKGEQKFSGVLWRPSAAARGSPILEADSVAAAECIVVQEVEAGDHWVLIASIEAGAVFGGLPLMYYRRSYASWPPERPAPIQL
jgi:flavin-dependent trigonelline monooxygenase, reductase component